MIRRMVAAGARTSLATRLIDQLERRTAVAPDRLTVLTYHRVDWPDRRPDLYPGLVSADPVAFEEQARHLARHYRPLSLDELLAVRDGASLPRHAVLLTFDDAYEDVVMHAVPILERLAIPSILFVPTAFPAGGPVFWWDRLHAALRSATTPFELLTSGGRLRIERRDVLPDAFRRLAATIKQLPHESAMTLVDELLAQLPAVDVPSPVASWQQLAALPARGMALAPHSHGHPRLDRLLAASLADELERPRVEFRERLGIEAPPVLAYPDGAHDEPVVEAARRAGYRIGLTTNRGTNATASVDWLRLRRINVGARSSLGLIRAQLLATRRPTAHAADASLR